MKNKAIFMGIIILGFVSIFGCEEQEYLKINNYSKDRGETLYEIYTVDENTKVYSIDPSPKWKAMELKELLNNKMITVEEILSSMSLVATANDGGSSLYASTNQEIYIAKCNSLNENGGIKDIFITEDENAIEDYCTKKEMPSLNEVENVTMTIRDGTLTRNGAIIIIKDLNEKSHVYGYNFRLDKKINGKWIALEEKNSRASTLVGYQVGKDKTLEMDMTWDYIYGELEKGEYRVVKEVNSKEFSVEFIIR